MPIRYQLPIFTAIRTIFNTAHRMIYPFLAVFARGLGVDVTAISLALTARALIGLSAPILSPIADRRGRRFGMLLGVSLFTFAGMIVALIPSLITFILALFLSLMGKYFFDPSMQAYLGDRVPYQRRGLALAATEMGWSLAFIAGIPLMGFLIERFGWSAPFPLFAILGAMMILAIWIMIPRDDPHHQPITDRWSNVGIVIRSVPALAGISIAIWASAANEIVNLIFGVWLEDSFGLRIAALGAASAVIGISELSGEGLVALFTDRLGKPRALAIGLIASAASSILLPFIGGTETGALIGLFFFYITFEFVMVSHVPMMTEVVPGARATVMSFNLAGHSVGRAIGALLATFIYQSYGFLFVAIGAMVFNIFALFALRQLAKGTTRA
jgi:predicted MFS family arabinose efflux permease